MKLNTRLDKLTHKEIRKIVEKTIVYSEIKFGSNKRKKSCKAVVKQQRDNDVPKYGEYCPEKHTVFLFKNNCTNVKDVICTTLHEYTHSLQPIKSKYFKLLKTYGYEKHPMEIEAVENEKYCKEVWKLIK
jgi:hypothetical protein